MRLMTYKALALTVSVVLLNATLLWSRPALAQEGRSVATLVLPAGKRQAQAATVMSSILREQMERLEGINVVTGSPQVNPQAEIEATRLTNAGFAALNTGDRQTALDSFQKAWDVLAQNPGVGDVRLHARVAKGLGVASFMAGNTDKGREMIKRSLLLYPAQAAREYAYTVDVRNIYENAKREINEMTPGSIEVRSTPDGAEVFLDGSFKGYTPITLQRVAPGSHLVEVVKDGYLRWSTAALVTEGGRVPTEAVLTASPVKPQLDKALAGVARNMAREDRFERAAKDLLDVVGAREALIVEASLGAAGFQLEGWFLNLAGEAKRVDTTIARDAQFYNSIQRFLTSTLGAAPKAVAEAESLGSPPAETIETVMKDSAAVGGDIAIDPDSPLFQVEDQEQEESVVNTWWFWTIIGVGAAAVAGTITAIVLTTGEEDATGAVGNLNITLESFGD